MGSSSIVHQTFIGTKDNHVTIPIGSFNLNDQFFQKKKKKQFQKKTQKFFGAKNSLFEVDVIEPGHPMGVRGPKGYWKHHLRGWKSTLKKR